MNDTQLMAQAVADAAHATKRQVQIWTDAGVLRAVEGTDRRGTGSKRLYDETEVAFAALAAEMANVNQPIGVLLQWANLIRVLIQRGDAEQVRGRPATWYREAIRGNIESWLVFRSVFRSEGGSFAWVDRKGAKAYLDGSSVVLVNVQETVKGT